MFTRIAPSLSRVFVFGRTVRSDLPFSLSVYPTRSFFIDSKAISQKHLMQGLMKDYGQKNSYRTGEGQCITGDNQYWQAEMLHKISELDSDSALKVMHECCEFNKGGLDLFLAAYRKCNGSINTRDKIQMFKNAVRNNNLLIACEMVRNKMIKMEENIGDNEMIIRENMMDSAIKKCGKYHISDPVKLIEAFFVTNTVDLKDRILSPSNSVDVTKYCLGKYEEYTAKTGDHTNLLRYCIRSVNEAAKKGKMPIISTIADKDYFKVLIMDLKKWGLSADTISPEAKSHIAVHLSSARFPPTTIPSTIKDAATSLEDKQQKR